MKIKMTRTAFLKTGIFGVIEPEDESLMLLTLEHAYPINPDGIRSSTSYAPKIPQGTYNCVRGLHRLAGMDHTFETFEVVSVPDHTNILFHPGNFNKDSSGCILLGLARQNDNEILHSKEAFILFMKLQSGNDSFALTIS